MGCGNASVAGYLAHMIEDYMGLQVAQDKAGFIASTKSLADRLVKKMKVSVKNCQAGERPKPVRTHLRNAIIMPEMVGAVAEVYGGKYWGTVEIKCDMVGDYLGEYAMTYKPVRHGKVGKGATKGSKFVS